MAEKKTLLEKVTKFIMAIVGAIVAIASVVLIFRKDADQVNTLNTDADLENEQNGVDEKIDELTDSIDNPDTDDLTDSEIEDYWSKR